MVVGVAMLVSHQWFYYYRPLDTKSRPLTVTKPESEFLYLANHTAEPKAEVGVVDCTDRTRSLEPGFGRARTPGSSLAANFLTAEVEHRGQILRLMYLNQVSFRWYDWPS